MAVRRIARCCLLICIAAGMACSCDLSKHTVIAYPPSWPLAGLYLPDGAIQENVPDGEGGTSFVQVLDGVLLQEGTRFEHRDWQLAYTYAGNDAAQVSYFDDALRFKHFQLLQPGVPKFGKRLYVSWDYKQEVALEWQDTHVQESRSGLERRDTHRQDPSLSFKGYVLTISVYTELQHDFESARPIPLHGHPDTD